MSAPKAKNHGMANAGISHGSWMFATMVLVRLPFSLISPKAPPAISGYINRIPAELAAQAFGFKNRLNSIRSW